jgi:hypothetical protein
LPRGALLSAPTPSNTEPARKVLQPLLAPSLSSGGKEGVRVEHLSRRRREGESDIDTHAPLIGGK